MSTQHSAIEWTDRTWNPVRGCTRVDEGCRNCYAERVAFRFSGPGQPYEGLAEKRNGRTAWTGKLRLVEDALREPLRWKKPKDHPGPLRIFVNSMSDLFHEDVPDSFIDQVLAVIALCPQHSFQVLTKRPERARAYFTAPMVGARIDRAAWVLTGLGGCWFNAPKNLWLGTSVSDQASADKRIPELLATPAAVRFVSYEPALGPVDFTRLDITDVINEKLREIWKRDPLPGVELGGPVTRAAWVNALTGVADSNWKVPTTRFPTLNWIICGGESGPGARPMHPDWARAVRDQCAAAGVAFFFKQWGEWVPGECVPDDRRYPTQQWWDGKWDACSDDWATEKDYGPILYRVGKSRAGRLLDGREHNGMPGVPA